MHSIEIDLQKTRTMRLIEAFFGFIFADKSDVKLFLGIMSVFMFLIILGSIPEEEEPRKPWYKSKTDYQKPNYKTQKSNNNFQFTKPVWEEDKKQKTQEWEDFIEELDNRGYDLWDPEAEDIWETYK